MAVFDCGEGKNILDFQTSDFVEDGMIILNSASLVPQWIMS